MARPGHIPSLVGPHRACLLHDFRLTWDPDRCLHLELWSPQHPALTLSSEQEAAASESKAPQNDPGRRHPPFFMELTNQFLVEARMSKPSGLPCLCDVTVRQSKPGWHLNLLMTVPLPLPVLYLPCPHLTASPPGTHAPTSTRLDGHGEPAPGLIPTSVTLLDQPASWACLTLAPLLIMLLFLP